MRYLIVAAALLFSGCAMPLHVEKRGTAVSRDAELSRLNRENAELRQELARKDEELKAQETAAQELRQKLRNFGVF